ncbi:MAG: hypothetical protein Ta2A_15730 [Treponemataceae bacterium]|nr:MAG: hypothetical protein Ta2A_15730 [Treponemataceae bacterium]
MKRNCFSAIFAVFFALVLSGCVSRLGAFTVISTKNIDWSRASEFKRYNKKVTGKDIYHIIILIPTKMTVSIEDAVDKAIEQVPGGVALIDAVVRSKYFYFPYIYGNGGYIVEGSVLIDPRLASADTESETNYLVFYPNKEKKFVGKSVTEEEYKSYL